jgi:hypothetical protein
MSEARHHHAHREIIIVPVPCGGSPETIRQTKPGRYPRNQREPWNGPPRRISKAESLARFLDNIRRQDQVVREMMRPDAACGNG